MRVWNRIVAAIEADDEVTLTVSEVIFLRSLIQSANNMAHVMEQEKAAYKRALAADFKHSLERIKD